MDTITEQTIDAATAIRERDEVIVRLTTDLEGYRAQAEELRQVLAQMQSRLDDSIRAYAATRGEVREYITEETGLDIEDMNALLERFDLDLVEVEWDVEVEVIRTYRGRVTVTASSADTASEAAVEMVEGGEVDIDGEFDEDSITVEVYSADQA